MGFSPAANHQCGQRPIEDADLTCPDFKLGDPINTWYWSGLYVLPLLLEV
jgi:hypothetical protein